MSVKRTASDEMKAILVAISTMPSYGEDWKRLSKKKNEQGQLVREFQNKATGEQFALTEQGGGKVSIQRTAESRVKPGPSPIIETDPAKNEAADKLIDLIISGEFHEEDSYQMERLIQKAWTALANRYLFAYCETEDGACWVLTPQKHWKETGYVFDQHSPIHNLMPSNAAEVTEATWMIDPEYFPPMRRAADLMARGFIFDPDFQRFIDDKQEKMIDVILNARKGPPAAKPPGPQPG